MNELAKGQVYRAIDSRKNKLAKEQVCKAIYRRMNELANGQVYNIWTKESTSEGASL